MAIPKPRLPFKRPDMLVSRTYKIKPPGKDSFYITIANASHAGEERPVEILINTKDAKAVLWVDFTTRMMSSVLQQPGDFPTWLIDELKSQFDADGGYFIARGDAGFGKGGVRVNSILHHIGIVLEEHMKNTK